MPEGKLGGLEETGISVPREILGVLSFFLSFGLEQRLQNSFQTAPEVLSGDISVPSGADAEFRGWWRIENICVRRGFAVLS